jgi:LysM repeat protein
MSTYKVVKGDTLYRIAIRLGTTVDALKKLNGLKNNDLKIGQVLKVPGTQAPAPPPVVSQPVAPPKPQPLPEVRPISYTVVRGDTLFGISRRFGASMDAIISQNNLKTTALSIGQVLRIPGTVATKPEVEQPPVVQPPPVTWPLPPVITPTPSTPSWPTHSTPPPSTPPPAPGDYLAARRQFGLVVRPDAGFQRFELTVPLLNGDTLLARMRNNVTQSAFMQYPEGIIYSGQSFIHLPMDRVQSVGLTPQQAAALEYVASHEGRYDAINSYDRGIFSFGSIQFVGAAEHGASLNHVLASMKANAPGKFAQVFQQVGIDSSGWQTTVLDESGRRLSGDEAWLYIQKTVSLYGAFIRAGFDPDLVLEQLRAANDLYVQPALNFRLNLNINGIPIVVPRLRDILSSEGLLTALIAIAINRGNGAMSRLVADTITTVAAPRRLQTFEALRQIDERLLCPTIADTTTDPRIRDRAQGVLDAGLAFAKA